MQSAFLAVVVIVGAVGVVGAVISLLVRRRTWDAYGRDRLALDSEAPPTTTTAERDEEVRQLLQARNAQRARRGEPPLNVEAELARLAAPSGDDQLRDEIRQLVVARNARRARRGEPPLDVETEVARELAELRFG